METDEPDPGTSREQGSFGDVLNTLLKTAGDKHDPPLGIETVMRFVVEPKGGQVPTMEELQGIHAVLITGSMYDAHGNDEWILKLIKLLQGRVVDSSHDVWKLILKQDLWQHRPDMRFSGVCFGHQILCRMLGSNVEAESGGRWELSHTHLDLSPVGKQLFRTQNDKLRLHQMHQDHVKNAPSPDTTNLLEPGTKVHVWGSSEHTYIQGIYVKNRLLGSQGHLGFDENMVKRQIQLRVDSGGIKDLSHAEAAKETADLEHDGEVVAAAILRLFRKCNRARRYGMDSRVVQMFLSRTKIHEVMLPF